MPKKTSLDLTPAKIEERVKKKEEDWALYFKRMDDDYELWNLEERIFDKHKGCINITSDYPRTYCDKLQRTLIAAPMQFQIKMPALDAPLQPQALFKFGFNKGDERLRRLGQIPAKESHIWHGLVRGKMSQRVLVYMSGDMVVFDITPLDPRWLTYEMSDQGGFWDAYKVYKTPEAIYHEYGEGLAESSDKNAKAVIDFWAMDNGIVKNTIIGESGLVLKKPTPHKVSRLPIVIVPLATRPQIVDTTGILTQGFGDSIYAPVRAVYKQLDELLSLAATQANTLAKAPVVVIYPSQGKGAGKGLPGESGIAKPTFYPGARIEIPDTHKLQEYPLKDVSGAIQMIIGILQNQRQEATLADVDFGRIGSPPPSGTAIQELKQAWDKALGPCAGALSYLYTDSSKLMHEQIKEGGFGIPVELVEGNKYQAFNITTPELDNKYYVNVTFTPRESYKQMESYQLGEMAMKLGISRDTVMEEFLNFPDIQAELARGDIEFAESQVPFFRMVRARNALEKQGREEERLLVENYLKQQGYQGYAGAIDAEQRIKGNQAMLGQQQMMGQPPQGAPQGTPPQGAPPGAPPQEVR